MNGILKTRISSIIILLVFAGFILSATHADAANKYLFVAENGSDTNNGTRDYPFKTLERARDEIRQLKEDGLINGPVYVYVKGTMNLTQPFKLTKEDSGTASYPITYKAYGTNPPTIISGGVPITGWTYMGNLLAAETKGLKFNSLYVNGQRAIRAREPDQEEPFPYYTIREAIETPLTPQTEEYDKRAFRYFQGDIDPNWDAGEVKDIELVSLRKFYQSRLRIDKIVGDSVYLQGKVATFFGDDYLDGTLPYAQDRYYLENHFEFLDSPGEWYLDKEQEYVYYYPRPGEGPNSTFIAPVLENLFEIGDYGKAKSYLHAEYVKIPDLDDFKFDGQSFTISFWARPDMNSYGPVLSKGYPNVDGKKGYGIKMRYKIITNYLDFTIGDGFDSQTVTFSFDNPPEEWQHFVLVFNKGSNTIEMYHNKEKKKTATIFVGSPAVDLPLLIGSNQTSVYDRFKGPLDEVKIFNRALTSDEIIDLYERNSGPEDAEVLSLSFEEGAFDGSEKLNHGIIYGSPTVVNGKFGNAMSWNSENYPNEYNNYVDYVNIEGMQFAYTDWSLPKGGYPGSQAGHLMETMPAVVLVTNSGKFQNNQIKHTGGFALASYSKNLLIKNNNITDVGGGGIKLGDVHEEKYADQHKLFRSNSLTNGNVIEDNTIAGIGKVFMEGPGVFTSVSGNNNITHNLIFDAPYSGMSLGWFTPAFYAAQFGNNTVAYNHIHNVMQELNDGGGIYLLGKNEGNPDQGIRTTQVYNNKIHDIVATDKHMFDYYLFGLYFDHAENIEARRNVVYRVEDSGIIMYDKYANDPEYSGKEPFANKGNLVENNIFADARIHQVYLESYNNDKFLKNIIYFKDVNPGELFYRNKPGIITGESNNNLFWNPSNGRSMPYFKFWNKSIEQYFYTSDVAERDKLRSKYSHIFVYLGIDGWVYKSTQPGTIPLYRFYNNRTGAHFYTIKESEKENLVMNYSHVWTLESNHNNYVVDHPTSANQPMYRLYNEKKGVHIFTKSKTEKDKLVNNYSDIFKYEGIAFYTFPVRDVVYKQYLDWHNATGQDGDARIEDPLFNNYDEDDFTLDEHSPMFSFDGFEQVDVSTAGPR